MPVVKDTSGLTWSAERVGRTSGIVSPTEPHPASLEPSDIIRFTCTSDRARARETTLKVGLLDALSQEELLELLENARQV